MAGCLPNQGNRESPGNAFCLKDIREKSGFQLILEKIWVVSGKLLVFVSSIKRFQNILKKANFANNGIICFLFYDKARVHYFAQMKYGLCK